MRLEWVGIAPPSLADLTGSLDLDQGPEDDRVDSVWSGIHSESTMFQKLGDRWYKIIGPRAEASTQSQIHSN